MSKTILTIEGMDCAEEIATLRKELGPLPGVDQLSFDLLNARMTVEHDATTIGADALKAAVLKTGMGATVWSEGAGDANAGAPDARHGRMILTSVSGLLIAAGFAVHVGASGVRAAITEGGGPMPWPSTALYAAAALAGCWYVLPKAWFSLRRFRPDMNLLMVIAVIGAAVIGEWFEAGTVAFLFALSILLEAWSVGRARRAVAALMALTPPKARVVHSGGHHARPTNPNNPSPQHPAPVAVPLQRLGGCADDSCSNGEGTSATSSKHPDHASRTGEEMEPEYGSIAHEHMTAVADVLIGSTVLVKPGEKFPLDGKIIKGETSVDQAPITGESMPVAKTVGDEVFAGSINGASTVEFTTTKAASDTTVSRIIRMVGEAQSRRSPSEQWVETFARYYTPTVMILAMLVILIPPILFGGLWSRWFYEGLVLLVIACPCALVISTPVSIVAALAAAARNGVLIKGGLFVELPSRLRALALDKTGTITEGRPSVLEVVPLSGHTERELLEIAAAIESQSDHPLARAVVSHAKAAGITAEPAQGFKAIHGKGASAVLKGKAVWIGSHRYLEERGQETPEMHAKLESLSNAGASVIVIGNEEHVCGFIAVADKVRAGAREAIAAIRNSGIEHIVMLTGDNSGTAKAVAQAVGIDEVESELLPEDKVAAIERLVAKYGKAAMVGDGVNDAPAMARSSLGFAMGAAGTDAAIETADIALMSDDLSRLGWLVVHSRRAVAIIRQNIYASLAVKAAFVILTILGHASLWAAIAADTGMSLLVVLNALRLLGTSGHNQS